MARFHMERLSGGGARNMVPGDWAEEGPFYDENNVTGIQLIYSFGFSHVRLLFKEGVKLTTPLWATRDY